MKRAEAYRDMYKTRPVIDILLVDMQPFDKEMKHTLW